MPPPSPEAALKSADFTEGDAYTGRSIAFLSPAVVPAASPHQSRIREGSMKTVDSRRTPAAPPATVKPDSVSIAVRQLHELIEALDRRVPHVERAGERAIARDAALLKAKALIRLAELEGGQVNPRR
jgi:hypothetical protein